MSEENERTRVDNVIRVSFGKTEESSDPDAAKKLEAFTRLIDDGMVMVTLDARLPHVIVPEHHRDDLQLALNFSLRFALDDFEYDLRGVRASLSFGGTPHKCDVPWGAVYMLRSHATDEVVFFKGALPEELGRRRTELYVHVESYGASDENVDRIRNRQRALGAPPGLLGAHTMRDEGNDALVLLSIWIDRPHFEAAREVRDASAVEAGLTGAKVTALEEI